MSISEGRSVLISRRIGSGRASMPSRKPARFRTVPRFWDEPFELYEPIPIAFGCFYQGIRKLPFRRRLTITPAVSLPTPATAAATSNAGAAVAASLMSAWTTTTTATGSLPTFVAADATSTATHSTASAMDPAVAAANVATPSVGRQKRKACPPSEGQKRCIRASRTSDWITGL
jgi:hypothetical protein